jgi:hypothetical protein
MATTQIRGTTQIMDGTIADAKIAAGANIQTSKLQDAPNFIKRDGSIAFTADQAHGTSDSVSASNFKITKVADPVNGQDAATRAWVLTQIAGISTSGHTARAATTANITLSATQTIDGVALAVGDRVLVKNQTTASTNGIYSVASGAWTRTTDMDVWGEVPGSFVSVQEGAINGDTVWLCTADLGGTLGTTNITFTQIPGPSDILAGAGLTRTGQTIDVVAFDNTIQVSANSIQVNQGTILAKADYIAREVPSGTINGSNTAFQLLNNPSGDNVMLFLNGILQEPGAGNDYTLSGQNITMLSAPLTGDRLRATYLKGTPTTIIT